MPVRFLLSTLKAGVDPVEYEAWVRERDYALVATLPNYVSYKVHRIRDPILGAETAGWMYIERIEVKSLEQHDADLASPDGIKLREELYGRFLERTKNVYFASDEIV